MHITDEPWYYLITMANRNIPAHEASVFTWSGRIGRAHERAFTDKKIDDLVWSRGERAEFVTGFTVNNVLFTKFETVNNRECGFKVYRYVEFCNPSPLVIEIVVHT